MCYPAFDYSPRIVSAKRCWTGGEFLDLHVSEKS